MAVCRLPATPGWICVLNNYQTNVYIQNNIHHNKNINNIIVIILYINIHDEKSRALRSDIYYNE